MKNTITLATLAAPLLILSACSNEPETAEEEAQIGAVEEAGLAISEGRMVMPPVSGNPGVVYFDVENTGSEAVTLVAVDVVGTGRTEIHDMVMADGMMKMEQMENREIAAGETAQFAPGGQHVMVFDLDPGIGAGSETEVTLMLSNGDKASFTVPIQAAGDDR